MFLQDENLKLIDVDQLKKELLDDIENEDIASEKEVEDDLGQMYLSASNATSQLYYKDDKIANFASERALSFSLPKAGRNILKKVKEFICSFLNEGSTASEIIDAILDAIASIIPGGVIIKGIIKKLVRFILSKGIGVFCNIA
ncbi:hypothetical protein ACS5NO_22265 [Larkinella sp. GY13]|uniref:hypothetical protein n=1 Tax=Larkinella sp. GY13 TaxID=3453720 RepID=UPI003EEA3DDA